MTLYLWPEKSRHLRRIRSWRLCITAKSPDSNHLCPKCQAKCFKCKYGSSGTPSHFRPILHFAVCFHGFMQISRSLSQRLLSFSLKWMISMYGGKCVWWCSNMMSPMCTRVCRWACALVDLEYSVPPCAFWSPFLSRRCDSGKSGPRGHQAFSLCPISQILLKKTCWFWSVAGTSTSLSLFLPLYYPAVFLYLSLLYESTVFIWRSHSLQ